MDMRSIRFFLCLCAALLLSGMPLQAEGGETAKTSTIEITKEAKITATIENKPLQEALRMMAEKNLFEIRGTVPAGEPVTVHFSNVTLDEALKKLMRGYNYVIMSQGTSQKPSLTVMGKIQADRPAAPSAQTASAPSGQPALPPTSQGLTPGTYYVPPTLLPPAGSPSPAPPGRRGTERRPSEQGNDTRQTTGQPQGQPPTATPQDPPAAGNPQQQQQPEQQQQAPQQQQQGEPQQQQQQQGEQPQTQPARSSGVSARDLLGRPQSNL